MILDISRESFIDSLDIYDLLNRWLSSNMVPGVVYPQRSEGNRHHVANVDIESLEGRADQD